jgi:hypothetical protein
MLTASKIKKRGLVMTGGGAKGFYEAGVLQALHLTSVDCDVITGSSIGAMNSLIYAEYLSRKRSGQLDPAVDAEGVNVALDHFIGAFLYAWLNLEYLDLIKDDDESVLAQLKNDVGQLSVDLPLLVRLLWWQTTPEARRPSAYFDVMRLLKEVSLRLGWEGLKDLLQRVRGGQELKRAALAAYLKRQNLGTAIILPDSPGADSIVATFTGSHPVLDAHHLALDYKPGGPETSPRVPLLSRKVTLDDYEKRGVEVRLTRANYRTGRLELSACYSMDEFAAYLDRQAWRLMGPELKLAPIGSHRLQVPGNPFAIDAALASGRFPGVFAPFPVQSIYDLSAPDNDMLRRLLTNWLEDPAVLQQLKEAYPRLKWPSTLSQAAWDERVDSWKKSARLGALFPHLTDMYVDGGAIDNTPSNSAVDAIREGLEANQLARRDYALDLFVVFLHVEPRAVADEAMNPELYEVVKRTLDIQATAKLTSDAVVVDTINSFGERGEVLARQLAGVAESVRRVLPDLADDQRQALTTQLQQQVPGGDAKTVEQILDGATDTATAALARKLPLHVQEIKIYPEAMPLGTLSFTPRLGYDKAKAIEMITAGCYSTLWTVRRYLEEAGGARDEADKQTLALARKWTGFDWPSGTRLEAQTQLAELQKRWQCRRTACVFHKAHCAHGARQAT